MLADERFLGKEPAFWAHVRSISQRVGYTTRKTALKSSQVRVPSLDEIRKTLFDLGLTDRHIAQIGRATPFGQSLLDYFEFRADVLNNVVKGNLMDAKVARKIFDGLKEKLSPTCPLPMNKQKGNKKAPAFFTGIINMLIWAEVRDRDCDYAPRELTTITRDGVPVRTLARWVDGAFPLAVNPIAVWEVKEYYYTTTFGSRVADGVYETLLDGMEIKELRTSEGIEVLHYLMVDDFNTWWNDGKSYLCRMIDMIHMGFVDEVLFGREVVERVPILAREWMERADARAAGKGGSLPEDRGN